MGTWRSTREHRTHTTGEGDAVRGLHKTPEVTLAVQPLSLDMAPLPRKELLKRQASDNPFAKAPKPKEKDK